MKSRGRKRLEEYRQFKRKHNYSGRAHQSPPVVATNYRFASPNREEKVHARTGDLMNES